MSDPVMELAGKTALVTGAGSGIGAAIAERFAKAGARVGIVVLHDDDRAKATLAAVRAAGSDGVIVTCDVGRPEDVENAFATVDAQFGLVTVLINDAGVDALGKNVVDPKWKSGSEHFVRISPVLFCARAHFCAAYSRQIRPEKL